jgi:hypothetical protein
VPLENADPPAKVRQPYSGRKAGEAGSDDDDIVVRAGIQHVTGSR